MRMMALAMVVFFVAIGMATMIESTYDIQTAKIMIYNAVWFEILLGYLCLNLIANVFRYRMYDRTKIALLTFHLSFIVIIIGAGITRHFSFEGLMLIREGQSTNLIYASEPHLFFRIDDKGKMVASGSEKMYMSEQTNNDFTLKAKVPDRSNDIKIEYVNFKRRQIDSLIMNDSIKTGVLDIVLGGMASNYVGPDGFVMIGNIPLNYEKEDAMPGINISKINGKLMVETKVPMRYLPMSEMTKYRQAGIAPPDSLYQEVPTDSIVPFLSTTLYQVNDQQFVFRNELPNSKMMKMSSGRRDVGVDILTVKIIDGKQTKIIDLEGGMGQIPAQHRFVFNGLTYQMAYGSTLFQLPFNILCRDFQLNKYPGSEVASSFASEVTIQDPANNYTRDQRIFMNNVMDYNGFRFFQSAYDLDDPATPENEEGTRLSVNKDWWGTNVTYLGYLLLAIGMLLSVFAPSGRFKELLGKIKKSSARRDASITILIVAFMAFATPAYTQDGHEGHDHSGHEHHDHDGHDHNHDADGAVSGHNELDENHQRPSKPIYRMISEQHAEELSSLLVQDFRGRIIPLHTLCEELLLKISSKNTYKGKNAVQVIMSMHMYPEYWVEQKIINVPKAVREELDLGEYASYMELMDPKTGEIKFIDQYNAAHQKLESKRSEFEKKIIKLVERHQVIQSFFSWQYMKLIPLVGDPSHKWYIPLDMELMKIDSISSMTALKYITSLDEAAKINAFGTATDLLVQLKKFQRETAPTIVPSETHVKIEIRYNKMHVFKNAMYAYLTIGFLLLILFYVRIFVSPTVRREKIFKRISLPLVILLTIIFLYHAAGLGMRWYISGHAPWSDGYEAVIFIAWVTMLAGFIFSKQNPVVLAGTAILAFFMIFVTELNLLDPEITPLQPVLKSYWLMIHVAIITGSYGFLGLGAILGFQNLVLYITRSKHNASRITSNINEITYISELTITIGLFMLTIGTFLGGIWANESWGRYWGWDPKETWALVSVLAYAILLHLRFIPALKDKFTFNLLSFWGYTAILFTFFGVNFYLVGLHSYANGDGLGEVPMWIFWTFYGFYIFSEIAAVQYQLYKKDDKVISLQHFVKKAVITAGILYICAGLKMWLIERMFDVNTLIAFTKVVGLTTVIIVLMYLYAQLRVNYRNKNLQS